MYVERNTPPGDDGMLAGLCKYTQLWLSKVALPLYPDMVKECSVTAGDNTPMVPNLENYFEVRLVHAKMPILLVYSRKHWGFSFGSRMQRTVYVPAWCVAGKGCSP